MAIFSAVVRGLSEGSRVFRRFFGQQQLGIQPEPAPQVAGSNRRDTGNVPGLLSADEVAAKITTAVRERRPFSFVRLGDDEGFLLSCTRPPEGQDAHHFRRCFGEQITFDQLRQLRWNLIASISSCDLLGTRDDVWRPASSVETISLDSPDFYDRFMAEFPLRPTDALDKHGARRIFSLYQWQRDNLPPTSPLCSSWVCYDLALCGFWSPFLAGLASVSVITSSTTVAGTLRDTFDLDVDEYIVPDRFNRQERSGSISPRPHFPDIHADLTAKLSRPHEGRVFLVGAGIPGKHYLKTIRDYGGIGIDVGAMLDAWDGRSTRPAVYRDKFGVDAEFKGAEKLALHRP